MPGNKLLARWFHLCEDIEFLLFIYDQIKLIRTVEPDLPFLDRMGRLLYLLQRNYENAMQRLDVELGERAKTNKGMLVYYRPEEYDA